jgi:hypothetical protein
MMVPLSAPKKPGFVPLTVRFHRYSVPSSPTATVDVRSRCVDPFA